MFLNYKACQREEKQYEERKYATVETSEKRSLLELSDMEYKIANNY